MRAASAFFFAILFCTVASAHEVTGTVQVLLKDGKVKNDLSDVVIYLSQDKEAKIPENLLKSQYLITTKNKQFNPRILAIPIGATVNFPNYDSIFHNIFSVSAPNQFDLGLYKGGASKPNTFASSGVVRVFCNVHPQMSATVIVTNTPYYTMADKQGHFSFTEVNNGSYELHAYCEEGQTATNLEMNGSPAKVDLKVDASKYKKLPHKNKFGKDYETDAGESY